MSTHRKYSRTSDDGLDRHRPTTNQDAPITVSNDDATVAHLIELGIDVAGVSVLPRNFATAKSASEFIFEEMTSTVRALGRQAGLTIDVPGSAPYRAIHEKDYELVVPVIVFAHAFLLEGGATLAVAFLEHLARHIASRRGAKAMKRDVFFKFVVTRGKHAKSLTYRGPEEGLPSVVEFARLAFPEDDK